MSSYRQILITDARLASLPTSGTAWTAMKNFADGGTVLQRPIIMHDNDLDIDNAALANAIMWRKTGTTSYQDRACNCCYDAIGSEDTPGGTNASQILPIGRHACDFVLAADIAEMHLWDATKFAEFKSWSNTLRTKVITGGSIQSVTEVRVNNWAAVAWPSRIALEIFNDVGGTNLPSAAAVNLFQGWLGDPTKRSSGWPSGGGCWYFGPTPMQGGVHPAGYTATVHGVAGYDMSGCLHDDFRRVVCPSAANPHVISPYVFAALGMPLWAAEMLRLRGYPVLTWVSSALRRAAVFTKTYADDFSISPWYGDSDNANAAWLANYLYDLGYPTTTTSPHKASMAFCDYLFTGTITGGTPTTIFESATNSCTASHTSSTYTLTGLGQIALNGTNAATASQDNSGYVLIVSGLTFTGTNAVTASHLNSTHTLTSVTATSAAGTNAVSAVVSGTARRYWSNDGGRSFISEWLEGSTNTATVDHGDSGFSLTAPIAHILTGINPAVVTVSGAFNVVSTAQIQNGLIAATVTVTGTAVYVAPPDLHDLGSSDASVDLSRSTFYLVTINTRPEVTEGDVRTTEKLLGENVLVGEMRTGDYYDVDDNDFGVAWATKDTLWQYHSWSSADGRSDFDGAEGTLPSPWTAEEGVDGDDVEIVDYLDGVMRFNEAGYQVTALYGIPLDLWNSPVEAIIYNIVVGATAYFRVKLTDGEEGVDSIWIEHYGNPGVIRAGKTIAGSEELLAVSEPLPTPIDTGMLSLRSQDGITYWEYQNTATDAVTVVWSEETPMDDRGTILRLQTNTAANVLAVNGT